MRWLATFRGAALMTTVLVAGSARAEQMVLFDITYTHTSERNFHHEVKAPTLVQPDNWTAPINYANGTIHFYQEVETKPTPRVTIIDFCFISNPGYGCIETLPYTKTGINETMRSMAAGPDWYQRNQINFTRKIGSIELVIKDPATYTNGCPGGDCVPSKMRFVATIVSPGGVYQKPAPGPGFGGMGGGSDGGATASPDAASTEPDAGAAPDADEPEVDAAVAPPPVKADAATSMEPKPTKADAAASKPPATTDPPTQEPDPTPTSKRKSSGCAVDGGPSGGALMLALVLLPALRRRRRCS
jgi:MYXO-CTERM domain-containing protein